jgi:hypothetical protein
MTQTITFQGADHTERSIKDMELSNMLALRNKAAENIGVTKIRSFKSAEQGAMLTWKMLVKWDEEMTKQEGAGDTEASKKKSAAKPKAETKPRPPVKAAGPVLVKRLTRDMFRKISFKNESGGKLAPHPGKGDRIARWDKYAEGMTLLHCMETEDLCHQDIGFYIDKGYMRLVEPTDDEYAKGREAWFKKQNRVDPDVQKAKDAEDRAAAIAKRKAEREAVAAKKKEEAEAKKKAAAEKKAAVEAEKAAKKAAAEEAKKKASTAKKSG